METLTNRTSWVDDWERMLDNSSSIMQREPLPDSETILSLPPDGGPDFNRLIHETSPYLLQHARNPIDWFPWGDEAKARAKAEDKAIFLSVGYSSCHWCHVMERESFENEEIAEILNREFVCIKVDREERPDVDDLYMTVTQLVTGQGGWPNSLWLLPDGRAWYAGTYYPPEDRGGHLGFKTLALRLADTWRTHRKEVEAHAAKLADAIRENAAGKQTQQGAPQLAYLLNSALTTWQRTYDRRHGGFGKAPKFPPHSALELILHQSDGQSDRTLQRIATGTLDAMALGGIHDHIGGGFHRYSTDEKWLVPHFEKMLYDNAQLAHVYTEAFHATGWPVYREVACRTLDWILRDMTGPEGAFYSAIDADSQGVEGQFYLWSPREIIEALGTESGELFCNYYQIHPTGNFFDEASGLPGGLNIPHLTTWPTDKIAEQLLHGRQVLLELRNTRAWPAVDDKRLTSWNGLAISAFARAGKVFEIPRYIEAASRAATFLLSSSMPNGELMRVWRAGKARVPAFLEDYGALADALITLFEADQHSAWIDKAEELARQMIERFVNPTSGLFLPTSESHENLLTRMPNYFDQSFPSSTSLAIRTLAQLANHGRDTVFEEAARRGINAVLPLAARYAANCAALLLAGTLLGPDEQSPQINIETRAATPNPDGDGKARVDVKVTLPTGWHLQSDEAGRLFTATVTGDFHLDHVTNESLFLRLRPTFVGLVAAANIQITVSVCNETICLPPKRFSQEVKFRIAAD